MMREKRRAVTPEERAEISRRISERILADATVGLAAANGGIVAVYLATPDEIDLAFAIKGLLARGATVVAPRWNGETYELAKLRGLGETYLRSGPMNVLEPAEADIVQPAAVSVWLVPGLAFTAGGGRVGYGGGWYDRLLAAASPGSVKLGVAYGFQIVDEIPREDHDIALTALVADGGI